MLPQKVLPPIVILSLCAGALLIGTLLYLYVFKFTRRKIHWATSILGILGTIFVSCEIVVIGTGINQLPQIGKQFHRIQALAALFFMFALPYFIQNLLELSTRWKNINKKIVVSGLGIAILISLLAFLKPDTFISLSAQKTGIKTAWNISRGVPGIFYKIRDIMLGGLMFYTLLCFLVDLKWHKRYAYVTLSLIGALIAIATASLDFVYASKEFKTGLFSIRVFSLFCLGITSFTVLSMIGVMKWFIDQTKNIEKAMKIESLGIFAGGIAHDFNNLLTAIMGNISLAKTRSKNDDITVGLLTEIEKASQRAKGLTRQLLTFSKGGAPIKNIASMHSLLTDTVEFVLSGSNIKSKIKIASDLWDVHIDTGQISQVIQNLILNAKQAMPKGGYIDVSAENTHLTPENDNQKIEKKYIKIDIKDYGIGINEKDLSSIFDPYYTTKEAGNGLGLSVCYSIIAKHSGSISVKSKLNEGTTFTILLPASEERHVPESTNKPSNESLHGKVLIMDDEEFILEVAQKMLQYLGLEVVCTKNGSEAARAYKDAQEKGKPFSLVILDLTISGGMGGKEALTLIKSFDPNVRALVSSGYSQSDIVSEYEKYGFFGIISKPYSITELKEAVENAILL